MGFFARDLKHLLRVFQPSRGRDRMRIPQDFIERVLPVVEALGSSRLQDLELTTASGATDFITMEPTPPDVIRLIKHCGLRHNDAGTHLLGFHYNYNNVGGNNRVNVEDDRVTIAEQHIGLTSAILVRPGDSFGVHVHDGPFGGVSVMTVTFLSVDLELGEVVPHLLQR